MAIFLAINFSAVVHGEDKWSYDKGSDLSTGGFVEDVRWLGREAVSPYIAVVTYPFQPEPYRWVGGAAESTVNWMGGIF